MIDEEEEDEEDLLKFLWFLVWLGEETVTAVAAARVPAIASDRARREGGTGRK